MVEFLFLQHVKIERILITLLSCGENYGIRFAISAFTKFREENVIKKHNFTIII